MKVLEAEEFINFLKLFVTYAIKSDKAGNRSLNQVMEISNL